MAKFWQFFSKRRTKAPPPDDDFWYSAMPGQGTNAGVEVDEATAIKYLTVFGCVSLISGDVGRLPLNLYRRRKDGGKDLITDHPLHDLLHNAPNKETTSFNWRETAQAHLLLWGNHFSFIDRDRSGTIIGLWQLPNPGEIRARRAGNEIVYEYNNGNGPVIRRSDQIFHVPGFGYSGLFGKSMIQIARESIGLGLATDRFGSNYFGQGTHPVGTLSMENFLGDNRKEYLKQLKAQYTGLGKSHNIMVLEGGMKYSHLTIPPNDSQFLETRQFQKTEICGFYRVPPHKVAIHGDNSNYSNLEQENASYVDSCLMQWLVRWEQQIGRQLLTEQERKQGLFAEFLVQGLLRGDSAARSEYYNKLFQVGALTPNEIRAKENMNPIDGGDQAFTMLNMVPLEFAAEADRNAQANNPAPDEGDEKKDDIKEQKKELKAFFAGKRFASSDRSILARDRITDRYKPLIRDAAQAVVNRETKAIKHRIKTRTKSEKDAVADFLTEFYEKFPEYIRKKLGPVLRSFLKAIVDESVNELNIDAEDYDDDVDQYIDRYAERHRDSSLGQMLALLENDDFEAIEQRADEWTEKRADKITENESVRGGNAAFQFVVFGAGLSLVWRTRGKSCPYCNELEGKGIRRGGAFVKSGDELDPADGTGKMKINGTKTHPPLHQGCQCYTVAG